MWWHIDKGNGNAKIPASMKGLPVLCSPLGLESPWCHDSGDTFLVGELGTAWGYCGWPVLWGGDCAPGGEISTEEVGKGKEEGVVGSSASCSLNGKWNRQKSRALRKMRAGRRGLQFGEPGPGTAKDFKTEGGFEMGISVSEKVDS